MTRKRFTYLDEVPLLSCCSEEEIERLARGAWRRIVPRDGIVQSEGQPARALALLIRGLARAVLVRADGREILLNLYQPGNFVAESNLFGSLECPCSIRAATRCEFVFVPLEAVHALLRTNAAFALQVLTGISQALFRVQSRLRDVLYERADRRILRYLADVAAQSGVPAEGGGLLFPRLRHQVIADACGLARETVTRLLPQLQRHGLLAQTASGWLLTQPGRQASEERHG